MVSAGEDTIPQPQESLEMVATLPSPAVISQWRYGTRLTNDPHPAYSAGLGKRTMDEIATIADQKRAERQALLKKKQEDIERMKCAMDSKI